jgi:hypothetical protein
MLDAAALDFLKERYRFDEWKGDSRTELAEPLPSPTQAFTFRGSEFAGWRLARQASRSAGLPGARTLIRTTWEGSSKDELLGIDVIECVSPAAARETLLRLLGEFQGPSLAPVSGIGDVAFGTPGETAIVFVRGNTVASTRNAGRRVVPLGNVARTLDRLLEGRSGEPEAPSQRRTRPRA